MILNLGNINEFKEELGGRLEGVLASFDIDVESLVRYLCEETVDCLLEYDATPWEGDPTHAVSMEDDDGQ